MTLSQAPRRIAVFGVGNADRGDDGIGPLVTRALRGRLPAEVPVQARGGDMLALVEEWSGCDALICVDALAPLGAPGRIHRLDLAIEELPRALAFTSSHAMGLADAIALARVLGRAPADIIVFGIEGCCFDDGAPMTPAVAAAAGEAADRVVAEVGRLRDGPREGAPNA